MCTNHFKRAINYFLLFLFTVIVSCKKDKPTGEEEPVIDKKQVYISKIIEYKPAPGQFVNDTGFGTLTKAQDLIGGVNNGLVSLGGFGGYIVFSFNKAVQNKQGDDFGIYGNPLIGVGMEFSEPGIVCVMQDKNKNGLPDDGEWYELAGSEYSAAGTIKKYTITYHRPANLTEDIKWTDSKGNTGYILRNQFHTQDYFPSWVTDSQVQFTGTLLKNTLQLNNGIITNQPFASGYADNGSPNYLKLQNQLGRGYNSFDIDWAVDAIGNKVVLTHIDFVKVYTAQNHNGNPSADISNLQARTIGEVSTEIGGAIDLNIKL